MAGEKAMNNVMAFKVDDSVIDYIQAVMITKRIFNRSEIQREIFMMGLEQFKKQNPNIKIEK